jgi:hypothetical protein
MAAALLMVAALACGWIWRADIAQWSVNRLVGLLDGIGGVQPYIDANRTDYLTEQEARIDVAGTVRAASAEQLRDRRAAAVRYIWKGPFPADRLPDSVESVTDRAAEKGLKSFRRARRLVVRMEHGIVVAPLLIETNQPKSAAAADRCLVVYHQDHHAAFLGEREWFARFLGAGCDVIAVPLPLTVDSPAVDVSVDGTNRRIADHNDFELLRSASFSPLTYFVEPSVAALNFALAERSYRRIAAVGLSGGGWLAVVVAALDSRFTHAYPVAGSLPRYLMTAGGRNVGDWEYRENGLYEAANFFELYLLGVLEPSRRAIHIYNRRDTCCFKGVLTAGFSAQLEGIARRWGMGKLRFHIDDSVASHIISTPALDLILDDFLAR